MAQQGVAQCRSFQSGEQRPGIETGGGGEEVKNEPETDGDQDAPSGGFRGFRRITTLVKAGINEGPEGDEIPDQQVRWRISTGEAQMAGGEMGGKKGQAAVSKHKNG